MASQSSGSGVGWERRNSLEGGLLKNHQYHHNSKDGAKAAWWCSWPKKAAGLRWWKAQVQAQQTTRGRVGDEKGGQAVTERMGAVSNVPAAVLAPRIPHVDSTTMLIARLHGAEIGGPRFNVQCWAPQAQLGLSWV